MPSFPITDSHVHLWDPKRLRYPWIDEIPVLNKSYLLEEYNLATAAVEVDKMVFLQCDCLPQQGENEAEWITTLAEIDKRIQGIIPFVPLEQGRAIKDTLQRYKENHLIKGVRRIYQSEPDLEFCLQQDFLTGIQMLSDYDMSFDICITHQHLKNTIIMVRQCPDVRFILDHIGKPDIKNQLFDPWRSELKELAAMDNVYCKISGLVTEADEAHWTIADLKPYVHHVIDCFGIDRVMYGGDWPVVLLASEYSRWIESLDQILAGFNDDELRKIYSSNAANVYRL